MASSCNELGYEDERFANDVIQEFHCPICLNVLRNPVMCRRNQHHFCTGCIGRHLENSQTCPTCMEELTLETLSPAPRICTSYLSQLKIRCDYFSRGCPEFVQLGNLESHVVNCGFSPVVCSNEGCAVEINKRDKILHETEVCELRMKLELCHDCVEMKKEIDEVKGNLTEVKANLTELKANLTELKANLAEVKGNLTEVKGNQTELKGNLAEVKGNLTEVKGNLTEVKGNLTEMNDQLQLQMRCMQDEIVNKVQAMIAEIKPVVVERSMKETVQQMSQGPTSEIREDIIVAGGYSQDNHALNSVEMFSWSTKAWVSLEPLNTGREQLSSFVYKDQMVVAGGNTQTQDVTNSMEAMNIDQKPRQWSDFPARLPARLCAHKNVVHKDRLFIVGGYDEDDDDYLDAIYEVLLVFPYSSRWLHRMPKPRAYHGIELHNNNIFIAGGTTSDSSKDSMVSIAKYDINKNEYREVGKLPFAVNEAATVKWRSYIVVIGGINKKGKVVDTVVLYDMEKEECHTLPSMRHKRKGCTAVVSGNLIVVIGGRDEEGFLNSVECFNFDQYSWEELPPMLKVRYWATAVVKPNQS